MTSVCPSAFVRTLALASFCTGLATAQTAAVAEAWSAFTAGHPGTWHVRWHPTTGTPTEVAGPGLHLGGRADTAAAARAIGLRFLRDHAALLATGSSTWGEASVTRIGPVWAMRYAQHHTGLPVIGGHATLTLHENGTLADFGAVTVPVPEGFAARPTVTAAFAVAAARAAAGMAVPGLLDDAAKDASLVLFADPERGDATPRLCWQVAVCEPTRRLSRTVWVDAATGETVRDADRLVRCDHVAPAPNAGHSATAARRLDRGITARRRLEQPQFAPLTGNVKAFVTLASDPAGPTTNVDLQNVRVVAQGISGAFYTDANGNFTIPNAGTTAIRVTVDLQQARRTNGVTTVGGANLSQTLSVTPGTPAQFQLGTVGQAADVRAQLDAYYHTDRVNEWARSLMRPADLTTFARLDTLRVIANDRSGACNAYFDPQQFRTNFFAAGAFAGFTCANSAIREIIYHEWGHAMDEVFGSPSPWVMEQAALGEAWGDTLGVYLTDQAVMGGSFGLPPRNAQNTYRYPVNAPDPHTQGQAFVGFAWDARSNLAAMLGRPAAIVVTERIVIGALAFNPSTQPEAVRRVFLLDDDDGMLNNGTPHYDQLAAAASAHGFTPPPRDAFAHTVMDPVAPLQPRVVTGALTIAPNTVAGIDMIASLTPGGATTRTLVANGNTRDFRGLLPAAPVGTSVAYRFVIRLTAGGQTHVNGGSYTVTGTTPTLTLIHTPEQASLGTTTTLRVQGPANAIFAVGFGDTAGPTVIGGVVTMALGGNLQFASALLDGAGSFQLGLVVPTNPALVNALFHTQPIALGMQLQPIVGNASRLLIQP